MAWWAQTEFDDEFGVRVSYATEWMGDSKERMDMAIAQVARDLMATYFTPDPGPRPWPGPASPFDPIHGTGPTVGFRQPMPDRPYQMRLKEKAVYLPDIFHGWIITNNIRDAIEALEPGVHQYLPFELYHKDGTLVQEQRWILNICNRLDTITPEHCNIGVFPDLRKYFTGNGPPDVKVWKHKVAGHAIWSEWKYNNDTYVSDALVDAIKATGAHGWAFRQYLLEI